MTEPTLSIAELTASAPAPKSPDARVKEAQAELATALARLRALPAQIAAAAQAVATQENTLNAAVQATLKAGKETPWDAEAFAKLDASRRAVVLLSNEREDLEASLKGLENSLKQAQGAAHGASIRARVLAADAAIKDCAALVQEMLDLGVVGHLQGPNGLTVSIDTGFGTTDQATITIRVPTRSVRLHPNAVHTRELR